ncbi:MAG: ABC transporter ATP-binding protein [Geminicoccaceae bacterium]
MAEPLLALDNLSKRFGDTIAADSLGLSVERGEIHAILGENGAGKSTLVKMIYGVLAPDAGTIRWNGEVVDLKGPGDVRALGIGMVFQHFSLFETLTVAENIALTSSESVERIRDQIAEIGPRFGLTIAPDALIHGLSMGERQRVEIVRALLQEPELIILDEPTSVLPPVAIPPLFETIRKLADSGCAVLFISHKLAEIRELCHKATIMRRGKNVATVDPTEESEASLARLMIGREIPHPKRDPAITSAEPALSVRGLSLASDDPFAVSLADITMDLHGGEIVGIAGISGNGQRLLAAALTGESRIGPGDQGRIDLLGHDVTKLGCAERRALGLAYVPEERHGRGAVPELDLMGNTLLTAHGMALIRNGFVKQEAVRAFTEDCIQGMDVRCSGPSAEARSLSGGNLQKFIVGRELALKPKVIVAAQPTWGVDVGAAQVILQRLVDFRREGVGIILISDELEDLLDVSDRLHVLFRGRLSPPILRAEASIDRIGAYMAGEAPVMPHEIPA